MRTRRLAGTGIVLVAIITEAAILNRTTGSIELDSLITIGVVAAGVALLLRRWLRDFADRLSDASNERQQLHEQQAQCQAATAANNALRKRLLTEAADLREATEARIAEIRNQTQDEIREAKEAIRREFEENRAAELCDAYYRGATNERNGAHDPNRSTGPIADLIVLDERRRPQDDDGRNTISSP